MDRKSVERHKREDSENATILHVELGGLVKI